MAIIVESPLAGQRIKTQTGRQQINVPSPVKGQGLIAIGRGVERLGVATARVDYQQRLEEERQREELRGKADRSMAYDGVSGFLGLLREGEGDYLSRKLGAASGVYNEAKTFADDRQREVEEQFQNDDQKLMFNSLARTHRNSFLNSMAAHERIQIEQWDRKSGEMQVNDGIRTWVDHYLDKDVVPTAKASLQIGLERMLPGAENDDLRRQIYWEKVSEAHELILSRFLANDPEGAKLYYDEHKKQILPENKIEIEAKLKHGLTEQIAQNKADLIVNSGIPYAEQLTKANEIKNAQVRKLVVQSVKVRKTEADFVEKEIYTDLLNSITKAVLDASSLEAGLRLARNPNLKGNDRLKLEKIAKGGAGVKTNLEVYYRLKQRPLDEFKKVNLMEYRLDLSDSRLKELISLQTQERKSDKPETVRTNLAMANDAFLALGRPEDKEDSERSQFRNQFFQETERRFGELGPAAKTKDKQAILNDMMLEVKEKEAALDEQERIAEGLERGEVKGGLGFGRGVDMSYAEAVKIGQGATWLPAIDEQERKEIMSKLQKNDPKSEFTIMLYKRVFILKKPFSDELKAELKAEKEDYGIR